MHSVLVLTSLSCERVLEQVRVITKIYEGFCLLQVNLLTSLQG